MQVLTQVLSTQPQFEMKMRIFILADGRSGRARVAHVGDELPAADTLPKPHLGRNTTQVHVAGDEPIIPLDPYLLTTKSVEGVFRCEAGSP